VITTEQATVYRGGGRRWFSAKAAAAAEARAKIKTKCDCDTADDDIYGTIHLTCDLHKPERYPKIVRRLARLYLAQFKAIPQHSKE